MTYRSFPASRILSTLAIALLAMQSPYAAISGSSSKGISIGDTSTLDTTVTTLSAATATDEKFTNEDLVVMRDRKDEVTEKIAKLEKDIAALKATGKTDDVTTLKLKKLNQDLADLKELDDVLDTLIAQAISDLTTKPGTIGSGDTGSGDSGGSGKEFIDQIKQVAINSLLQSFLGGNNNALNNLTSSITNGLTGGGFTGGLTNPTGTPTGGVDTGDTGTTKKPTKEVKEEDPYEGLATCGTTDTTPGKAEDDKVEPAKDTASKDYIGPRTAKEVGDAVDAKTKSFPGKDADDKVTSTDDAKKAVETAAKPKCRPVDVTTPNPTAQGGELADGKQSNKITSIADAEKFVGKYWCDPSNSNCSGNGQECASLTKYFCPDVGRAGSWQGGTQVKGNNIAVGTCVATFSNNGNYGPAGKPGGASGKSHTGVYLGQNSEGVILLHQWNGSKGARISTVPWSAWGRGGAKQGGNVYKTIGSINVFKGIDWFLPPITIAFDIPLGEGLAKTEPDAYNKIQGLQS